MEPPAPNTTAGGEDNPMHDANVGAGGAGTSNAPANVVHEAVTGNGNDPEQLPDAVTEPTDSSDLPASGEVLTRTLLQVLDTQRQQAEFLRLLMEKHNDGSSSGLVAKKADKVLWAALDKVRRFDGLGTRTFDMFLSDFMNAADMAELAPEKYLKVMHSMVVGEALTYARNAVIPPVEKGGLDSLTMDEYVEKMKEGRFGDALNPIQRTGRILCMAQHDKTLEAYLRDVERELNLLPQDTPGWVKVSLALWGMRATVACQVQSNPRDPSGMFHDYIQFRNHALSTMQMPNTSQNMREGKQPVWKRQGPTPPAPPTKMQKPTTVDWSKIQCRHCGTFGHGSAANRSCPKHDPTYIRRGLNQLPSPPQKSANFKKT